MRSRQGSEPTETTRDTVIIALTASSLLEDRDMVLASGCDDFLHKPFHIREIFTMMHLYLGVRYVYEHDTSLPSPEPPGIHGAPLTPEAYQQIPKELLAKLRHATITNDILALLTSVEEIRSYQPELACYLTTLAGQFDYETILNSFHDIDPEAL